MGIYNLEGMKEFCFSTIVCWLYGGWLMFKLQGAYCLTILSRNNLYKILMDPWWSPHTCHGVNLDFIRNPSGVYQESIHFIRSPSGCMGECNLQDMWAYWHGHKAEHECTHGWPRSIPMSISIPKCHTWIQCVSATRWLRAASQILTGSQVLMGSQVLGSTYKCSGY